MTKTTISEKLTTRMTILFAFLVMFVVMLGLKIFPDKEDSTTKFKKEGITIGQMCVKAKTPFILCVKKFKTKYNINGIRQGYYQQTNKEAFDKQTKEYGGKL